MSETSGIVLTIDVDSVVETKTWDWAPTMPSNLPMEIWDRIVSEIRGRPGTGLEIPSSLQIKSLKDAILERLHGDLKKLTDLQEVLCSFEENLLCSSQVSLDITLDDLEKLFNRTTAYYKLITSLKTLTALYEDNLGLLLRQSQPHDHLQQTALHYAAYHQNLDMVNTLLKAGADVNALDAFGCSPLHLAAKSPIELISYVSEMVVEALLKANSNVMAQDEDGLTALHCAVWRGTSWGVVDILVEDKQIVNVRDNRGRTALHFAAENGDLHLAISLLDAGADIAAQDNDGQTALHYAVSEEGNWVVAFLDKIIVNVRDNQGRTALHIAARILDVEVTNFLLGIGADIKREDINGKTPEDIIKDNKWEIAVANDDPNRLNVIARIEGSPTKRVRR